MLSLLTSKLHLICIVVRKILIKQTITPVIRKTPPHYFVNLYGVFSMSKSVKMSSINKQIVTKLDVMKSQYEHFESNEMNRSNKKLYSLLGDVYSVFKGLEKKDKGTSDHLKTTLKQRGVKVQKNTPLLTVVIRYVFNSDRSKSYNYNRVISSAIQKNISPEDLPSHIQEMGGIEECKKEYIPSQRTIDKKQRVNDLIDSIQREFMGMEIMGTLETPNKIKKVDGCQFVFTIGRLCEDGKTIELVDVLTEMNNVMEKTALKLMSKKYK